MSLHDHKTEPDQSTGGVSTKDYRYIKDTQATVGVILFLSLLSMIVWFIGIRILDKQSDMLFGLATIGGMFLLIACIICFSGLPALWGIVRSVQVAKSIRKILMSQEGSYNPDSLHLGQIFNHYTQVYLLVSIHLVAAMFTFIVWWSGHDYEGNNYSGLLIVLGGLLFCWLSVIFSVLTLVATQFVLRLRKQVSAEVWRALSMSSVVRWTLIVSVLNLIASGGLCVYTVISFN